MYIFKCPICKKALSGYAKSKYGENYEELFRYYNFTGNMILYY